MGCTQTHQHNRRHASKNQSATPNIQKHSTLYHMAVLYEWRLRRFCTHPCSGGVGGVDRVIQDVGEKRQQVAEWLVGVVGDHDSVASLSDGRPAVTVCCGRRVILLPSAHLSMTTQRGVSFGESTRTRTRSIIITLITGNFNKASRADTQRQSHLCTRNKDR